MENANAYAMFLNLCTDELKPLNDDELQIVARALSPGVTLEEFVKISISEMSTSWPGKAQSDAEIAGQLVAASAYAAALVPRLLATIDALKPELKLVNDAVANTEKARKILLDS